MLHHFIYHSDSHFDGFSFNLKVIKVLTLCSYQHKILITFKRRPKFIFDFNKWNNSRNSWLLCVDGVWNFLEIRIIIEGSCQIFFFLVWLGHFSYFLHICFMLPSFPHLISWIYSTPPPVLGMCDNGSRLCHNSLKKLVILIFLVV